MNCCGTYFSVRLKSTVRCYHVQTISFYLCPALKRRLPLRLSKYCFFVGHKVDALE